MKWKGKLIAPLTQQREIHFTILFENGNCDWISFVEELGAQENVLNGMLMEWKHSRGGSVIWLLSWSSLFVGGLWAGGPANGSAQRRERRQTTQPINGAERQRKVSEVKLRKLMKLIDEMNWTGNQAATAARQAHQQTKTANPSTHFSKRKKSESWLELLCLLNGKSCKSTNQFFSQFLQLLKKWRRMVVEWVNWKVIITVNRLHRN